MFQAQIKNFKPLEARLFKATAEAFGKSHIFVATLRRVAARFDPRVVAPPTIATEIQDAIKASSSAVAPDSSIRKRPTRSSKSATPKWFATSSLQAVWFEASQECRRRHDPKFSEWRHGKAAD